MIFFVLLFPKFQRNSMKFNDKTYTLNNLCLVQNSKVLGLYVQGTESCALLGCVDCVSAFKLDAPENRTLLVILLVIACRQLVVFVRQ